MSTLSSVISTGNPRKKSNSAKQFYSFGKASRFGRQVSPLNSTDAIYSIPSSYSKRATSFGFGGKSDFTQLGKDNPAPNTYQVLADYSKSSAKRNCFSFGISREQSQKRTIEGHFKADPDVPGPGTYTTPNKIGNEGRRFSLLGKGTLVYHDPAVPGPGAYNSNIPVLSKHSSAKEINFSKMPRFPALKVDSSPGFFDPGSSLNRKGGRFSFSSSRGSFPYIQNNNPGPGAYQVPCEFGVPKDN